MSRRAPFWILLVSAGPVFAGVAPLLSSPAATPSTMLYRGGAVTLSVAIQDPNTGGIQNASATVQSPDGTTTTVVLALSTGSAANGTWQGQYTIPTNFAAVSQVYDVSFSASDSAGNVGQTPPVSVSVSPAGPGDPSLQLTSIPSFGSSNVLSGRVANVSPQSYQIAILIFVEGLGWFSKPYCSPLFTTINSDLSWSNSITTGGVDPTATEIAVYLVPAGTSSYSCVTAGAGLPASLESAAVAKVVATRTDPNLSYINFAQRTWWVKSNTVPLGPGPTNFSSQYNLPFVDASGRLHLKLVQVGGTWYGAEIVSSDVIGNGQISFTLDTDETSLDPNVVIGFFTWSDDPAFSNREIDVELGRFGNGSDPNNAQFVAQPYQTSGDLLRFAVPPGSVPSSYGFQWYSNAINFEAAQGTTATPSNSQLIVKQWTESTTVPQPGNQNFRMNVWLFNSAPPANGQPVEAIVDNFQFTPLTVTASNASPIAGSGSTQTFNVRFSDSAGVGDLNGARVWFSPSLSTGATANSCLVFYSPVGNQLYLHNDAGNGWLGPAPLGSTTPLSNAQCSVNAQAASIVVSGNQVSLSLPVTFFGTFAGMQNVYGYASGVTVASGWQNLGTWAVPESGQMSQTISFAAIGNQVLGTGPVTFIASTTSGLPLTFTSNTPAVCSVSGNQATPIVVGTCSVTASQSGNATYAAATPVTQTFTVVAASATDPGATSSLVLVSGTINGQSITPGNATVFVSPGASISGSFNVSVNSTWPGNDVMAMGVTPTWGQPASAFTDLGGFGTPAKGLQRTIPINLTAPAAPGTYYVIAAFRAEFSAAQVMSCTNWTVGSPVWTSGYAIADWSAQTIDMANANGTVPVNYIFPGGDEPQYVPATAIKIVVSSAPPPPSIVSAGPACSAGTTIESGEWVSVYGNDLAASVTLWNADFPTSLGGTSVTINGKPAFLSYVGPGQINLQAPNDAATGPVSIVVTTASGSATSTVTLAQLAPCFATLDGKHVAGIILRSDKSGAYGGGTYDIIGPTGNSLGYATVAAKAGDVVELFGTGFGPTNPAVSAGQVFMGAAAATDSVGVTIGNLSAAPSFAGLSGAGLDQVNLVVPASLSAGDLPLAASVGGVQTSSGVVMSVQSATSSLSTVRSLTLSPASVVGGGAVTGTVTLSAAAPSGGALVSLSSASGTAPVPAGVTVAAGASSATFTFSAGTVSATQTITITASYGGNSVQATLTVTPAPAGPPSLSFCDAPTALPRNQGLGSYSPALCFQYAGLQAQTYTLSVWLLETQTGSYFCASTQWCQTSFTIDNTNGNNAAGQLVEVMNMDVYDYNGFLWVARMSNGLEAQVGAAAVAHSPPVLNPVGNQTAAAGQDLEFVVSASDPSGYALTFQAQGVPLSQGLPSGASFDAATGRFSWPSPVSGAYQILFNVVESTASPLNDSELATLTIR